MPAPLTFKQAAEKILGESDHPLSPSEIVELALEAGIVETEGATPEATMGAQLYLDIRNNPQMSLLDFSKLFNERADKYNATEFQKATGIALFEKFKEKHNAVEKARAETLMILHFSTQFSVLHQKVPSRS